MKWHELALVQTIPRAIPVEGVLNATPPISGSAAFRTRVRGSGSRSLQTRTPVVFDHRSRVAQKVRLFSRPRFRGTTPLTTFLSAVERLLTARSETSSESEMETCTETKGI